MKITVKNKEQDFARAEFVWTDDAKNFYLTFDIGFSDDDIARMIALKAHEGSASAEFDFDYDLDYMLTSEELACCELQRVAEEQNITSAMTQKAFDFIAFVKTFNADIDARLFFTKVANKLRAFRNGSKSQRNVSQAQLLIDHFSACAAELK